MDDGGRWLNQAHRDDIVRGLTALGRKKPVRPGVIYNICDDRPITQLECYGWLARHFKRPLPPSRAAGPRAQTRLDEQARLKRPAPRARLGTRISVLFRRRAGRARSRAGANLARRPQILREPNEVPRY